MRKQPAERYDEQRRQDDVGCFISCFSLLIRLYLHVFSSFY